VDEGVLLMMGFRSILYLLVVMASIVQTYRRMRVEQVAQAADIDIQLQEFQTDGTEGRERSPSSSPEGSRSDEGRELRGGSTSTTWVRGIHREEDDGNLSAQPVRAREMV
jgi:hypothetical protein